MNHHWLVYSRHAYSGSTLVPNTCGYSFCCIVGACSAATLIECYGSQSFSGATGYTHVPLGCNCVFGGTWTPMAGQLAMGPCRILCDQAVFVSCTPCPSSIYISVKHLSIPSMTTANEQMSHRSCPARCQVWSHQSGRLSPAVSQWRHAWGSER